MTNTIDTFLDELFKAPEMIDCWQWPCKLCGIEPSEAKASIKQFIENRVKEAEERGEFFMGSKLSINLGYLLVHTTEVGFPPMTAEIVNKLWAEVQAYMEPTMTKHTLTESKGD